LNGSITPQIAVDLSSATSEDVYVVQWYRVQTGATVDMPTVTGGSLRYFTSPWIGEDAVLYLSRISADFNDDGDFDFEDFAILASYWMSPCFSPDWCWGKDLDQSGTVDLSDLITLTDNWLY
ncbi:MAG: hypothetical protein J7K65_08630, partial [Planctomycetes bacterium]|nr:hypothetical protein [Planctomycetota bacterium]